MLAGKTRLITKATDTFGHAVLPWLWHTNDL